jgi:hypothetical protein
MNLSRNSLNSVEITDITMFTEVSYLPIPWARWIQSTFYCSVYFRYILILYFSLRLPKFSKHLSSYSFGLRTLPIYPPWLDHSNYTWWRVQVWSSSLCSFLQPPVTSSRFSPNILLNTLFSNTLSLCCLWDQVSHPYRTTREITVTRNLDGRREDKRFGSK